MKTANSGRLRAQPSGCACLVEIEQRAVQTAVLVEIAAGNLEPSRVRDAARLQRLKPAALISRSAAAAAASWSAAIAPASDRSGLCTR